MRKNYSEFKIKFQKYETFSIYKTYFIILNKDDSSSIKIKFI